MEIKYAPEPSTINWYNLGIPFKKIFVSRLKTYFVTFLLLIINFLMIIGLKIVDRMIKESFRERVGKGSSDADLVGWKAAIIRLISILVALVIQVVNRIMLYFLKMLTSFERWSDLTQHYASYTFKNVFAVFINSNLLIVIAHLYLNRNTNLFYIWGKGYLVNDVFYILISSLIFDPLLIYFDPVFLLKKFKQKKLMKAVDKRFYLQKDANDIFEGPELDLADSYANLVSTFWMALFFTPIFPVATLITGVAFLITYWLQKTLLLRRYARPRAYSGSIAFLSMYLLRFSPFIMMTGYYFLNYILRGGERKSMITIGLICSGVWVFFGSIEDYCLKCFKIVNNEAQIKLNLDYNSVRHRFYSEFDRENPITSKDATEEYLNWITSRLELTSASNLKFEIGELLGVKESILTLTACQRKKKRLQKQVEHMIKAGLGGGIFKLATEKIDPSEFSVLASPQKGLNFGKNSVSPLKKMSKRKNFFIKGEYYSPQKEIRSRPQLKNNLDSNSAFRKPPNLILKQEALPQFKFEFVDDQSNIRQKEDKKAYTDKSLI